MLGSAVEPLIQAQIAAARNFRGIRFRGGGADTIDFDDPSFREGVAVLAKHGLVLDCNGPEVRHPHRTATWTRLTDRWLACRTFR